MTKNMTDGEIKELNIELLNLFRKYAKFVTPLSLKKMKKDVYEIKFKCPFCKQITNYKNCFLKNKFTYGFHIICRKCHMRSVLVGPIKKLAYKHYAKTRFIKDYGVSLMKRFKKNRL